jgi:hypothetical protein
MGVIKSVIPIVDFDIVSHKMKDRGHNINNADRFGIICNLCKVNIAEIFQESGITVYIAGRK